MERSLLGRLWARLRGRTTPEPDPEWWRRHLDSPTGGASPGPEPTAPDRRRDVVEPRLRVHADRLDHRARTLRPHAAIDLVSFAVEGTHLTPEALRRLVDRVEAEVDRVP